MGKKINFEGKYHINQGDVIPGKNIYFPILEIKPYPEFNPKESNGKDTFFITSDSYVETADGKVGYRDVLSDSIIFISQLDSLLDRSSLTNAVERIGKTLIPTMQGGNNFEVKNWGVYSNPDTTVVAAYKPELKGIYLNLNRGSKGISDNIYVLRSTIRHELIHFRDKDKWNNYQKNSKFTFKDHANVYLEQMTYEEFLEAPRDFQAQIIYGYVKRLVIHAKKEKNYTSLYKDIKEFNEGLGQKIKAEIKIQKYGGFSQYSEDLKSFSVEIRGVPYTERENKQINNPYD